MEGKRVRGTGFIVLAVLTGLLCACGGGNSGGGGDTNPPPPPPPTITAVSVVCNPTTINTGSTSACTVQVTGTGAFTSTVTWASSNTAVATVSNSGTVTGVAQGTATVTATSTEDTTKSGSVSVTVVLSPPSAAFQLSGPAGALPAAIVADQTVPGTVYAISYCVGAPGQIWRSTDSGQSWQNITGNLVSQLPTSAESCFADVKVSSVDGAVYVGSNAGAVIYKSSDHGKSWSTITLPAQQNIKDVTDIALDPLNNNSLYALTANGNNLLGSRDGGATWSQLSTACSGNVVADPKTEGTLYCLGGGGFLVSKDGGITWTAKTQITTNTGLTLSMVRFAIAPSNPAQVYLLAGFSGTFVASLFSSSDGGTTWTATDGPGTNSGSGIVVNPINPLNVFVTSDTDFGAPTDGLISSTDGGRTWVSSSSVPPPGGGGSFLAMLPGPPLTLIGYWGTHLWKTTDGGASWLDAGQGVSGLFGMQVVVDPKGSEDVYLAAADGGGLYKSSDGGKTWSNTLVDGCYSIAIDPFDSNHLLAGCGNEGPVVSADGGTTWQSERIAVGSWSPYLISTIVFDPNTAGTIFVGGYAATGLGLAKSSDGGATWSFADSGLPSTGAVYSLAVQPSESNVVLAGMDTGVYKSSDGGATWALKMPAVTYSIAFDPSNPKTVYASGNELLKSTDAGDSWSQVPVSGASFAAPLTLVVDPASANTLFLIPLLGPVGWSPDGGNTWDWLSNGLSRSFLSIGGNGTTSAIARTTPEVLYIPSSAVSLISLVLQH